MKEEDFGPETAPFPRCQRHWSSLNLRQASLTALHEAGAPQQQLIYSNHQKEGPSGVATLTRIDGEHRAVLNLISSPCAIAP